MIEELYQAAQQRGPAERAALLESSDPEVRSEVQRMLAQASDGKILDLPADRLLDASTQAMVTVGSQLGPYKVEAAIGAGGMGVVYRAHDTRLGREVAIKVANARYTERFEREAQVISTLNHPHICTLYDVGPDYLVMELLEGSTLAEEIQKGRACASASSSLWIADRERTGGSARTRHRASRPQARQHHGHAAWFEGAGFWPREEALEGRTHREQRDHGDARLHGAGAVGRPRTGQ